MAFVIRSFRPFNSFKNKKDEKYFINALISILNSKKTLKRYPYSYARLYTFLYRETLYKRSDDLFQRLLENAIIQRKREIHLFLISIGHLILGHTFIYCDRDTCHNIITAFGLQRFRTIWLEKHQLFIDITLGCRTDERKKIQDLFFHELFC